MKWLRLITLSTLFVLGSCGEDSISRIGESLGRGIVQSINADEYVMINGQKYYKTLDCTSQYGYVSTNFKRINPLECLYHNELHYVSFQAGSFVAGYIYVILN